MADIVTQREFMTTWHDSPRQGIEAWSLRSKANLIGSGTSTDRVPPFRPFDLLAAPNEALVVLENDDHRIGVQSVCGAQPAFVRHIDFDTVYFQFAGETSLETEFGDYHMAPGELSFIPEGIAHRSTGTADSLRWFAFVSGTEPIFRAPHMEIKTYNIRGEQFAFHRALRSEEVRIQFRGEALDTCEIDKTLVAPGDVSVIPRGIAHSVITEPPDSPLFLRLNFYSNLPWRMPADLTRHHYKSTFEVQTTVVDEAAWRIEAGLVIPTVAAG
jgi:hypothetical protein